MALQQDFEKQGNWLFKYRSFIPIPVFGLTLVVYLYKVYVGNSAISAESDQATLYEFLCLLVGLIGLLVRVITVGHTPRGTSGRNTLQGQMAEYLNTTGMYSVVRHPLYLGNFLMWFAPVLLTQDLWFIISFCLFYWLYYERIMYAEEQFLARKYGDRYVEWAASVPTFIPRLTGFKKPELKFNWKKVVRREKNGLFALFFVFTLFDIAAEVVKGQNHYNRTLIILTIISCIAYLILKYLKDYTKLLIDPKAQPVDDSDINAK